MVVASMNEETKRASGSVELVILAVLMSHLTNKMDKQWHDWKPAMKYSGQTGHYKLSQRILLCRDQLLLRYTHVHMNGLHINPKPGDQSKPLCQRRLPRKTGSFNFMNENFHHNPYLESKNPRQNLIALFLHTLAGFGLVGVRACWGGVTAGRPAPKHSCGMGDPCCKRIRLLWTP